MRTRSPSLIGGSLWDAPCRGGALLRPLLQISSEERAEQSPAPNLPRKKVTSIWISNVPSIDGRYSMATSCKFDTPVSGGAYQDARKVSIEWNARLKHRRSPEFRCRMQTVTQRPFSPPSFRQDGKRRNHQKARQKRPRRNEPPQATSLILCARFFLSKPQTKFAVWIFLCKSDTTSQSRLRRASSPGRGAFLSAAAEVTPLQGQRRGRGSRWSRTDPRMCPLFACRSA